MGGKDVIRYVDWDEVVQRAETNLEIINGNQRKAEVGEICEKTILEFALKERAKFPTPPKVSSSTLEKGKENGDVEKRDADKTPQN